MSYSILFMRRTPLTYCFFFSCVCGNKSKEWSLACRLRDTVFLISKAHWGHINAYFSPPPVYSASCFSADDYKEYFRSLPWSKAIFLMSLPHITLTSKLEACLGGYKVVAFLPLTSERKPWLLRKERNIIKGQVFFLKATSFLFAEKPMTPDDHWGSPAGFL